MNKSLILLAAVLPAVFGTCREAVESQKSGVTTLVLVRHAEKAAEPADDPPLTIEGRARADALAYLLHHVDITAVYSTPYLRTEQTAFPTAEDHGLEVRTYRPRDAGFSEWVVEEHAGGSILIVGHSNTIPGLVNSLSGRDSCSDLPDTIYDNLFIVSVTAEKKASVLRLRYGERTPEEK